MAGDPQQLGERKSAFRRAARAARKAQSDRDALSRTICRRAAALLEYASARVVLLYVDCRSEVRTGPLVDAALAAGRRMAVPYCVDGQLQLFELRSTDELAAGMYGIREPREDLRALLDRRIGVEHIDALVVPGVAFDRRGARLGQGMGYYDKLLPGRRADAFTIGLAYECQVFHKLPTAPHDIAVDCVVTEAEVYRRKTADAS